MNRKHLEILQHSLGVDEFGRGPQYRNHFVAGEADAVLCRELVALGFMTEHARSFVPHPIFVVTQEGRKAMFESSPKPPKLSRSQIRYRRFLNWSDACSGTFREFLTFEKQERAERLW